MKSKLLTASLLIFSALQVACSDDDKGVSQAQLCAKDPACWQRYSAPSAVKAIAGQGAVAGMPQVAPPEAGKPDPSTGLIPNPAILPASIQAKQKQIASTLQAINDDPDFRLTNGTNTLLPAGTTYVPNSVSSGGSSSAGEITVAHIQSNEPEVQRQPTAYQPASADPNSVFAQPEAIGSR